MNTVAVSQVITATPDKVWKYVSDFSDASHQMIAVTDTQTSGDTRVVSFKNGHQVSEKLIANDPQISLRWSQETQQGFIPIKNVEEEITLKPTADGTEVGFLFHYDTKMGPMGWLMNLMMVRGKLAGYAKGNLNKIARKLAN